MSSSLQVAVVGATGHTGRFVLDELARRDFRSILVARDSAGVAVAAAGYRGSEARVAHLEDAASLDAALCGTAAVINCAGPFRDTALPVIEAALRANIPYLDVTAEQAVVQAIYVRDAAARRAGVTLVPACAFFGGLADLLASSLCESTPSVDEIAVAVFLDSWHPTQGTRLTGSGNTSRRLVVRHGVLVPIEDQEPNGFWIFPQPVGGQAVAMLSLSETIILSHHIKAETIESWINLGALHDVGNPTTPPPRPADERRRSSQRFVMDVVVRTGEQRRRATAIGRDIYAVSAPIIVEALQRIVAADGAATAGVRSLAEISNARAFLETLVRSGDIEVEFATCAHPPLNR